MAHPSRPIFACALLVFLAAAAPFAAPASAAAVTQSETCVPSLQRMLSCLDFIEHRSDEIPVPCCVQVNATVAQQPCCLMHVVRGNVARLIGPEYDGTRALVNVTVKCLGDASILTSITRNCSG
ncbi:non-specific lipid-transfer protein C6-like [Phragmites australis]|uniref:non-specific lipid-transfer protein C6-like n=1 Tax=Phragmites australis TaxID=29695 RepID=UPI002D79124C|nr:non-specific lipid-transfer protein C6-like [Phragmites australis]